MRAVVMAGGQGTRLRPLTVSAPKPLLPVAGRPLLEHGLRLLQGHGISEAVVTLQYLPALVRSYFGDGADLGMDLRYASEPNPLGTAGGVRAAREALKGDAFVVLSADALTDVDLTGLTARHRSTGAVVTMCLARKSNPVDFGVVEIDAGGRVRRLIEKPQWGQVFSDTVSTGIYVMEPEVLESIRDDRPQDWSQDVLPRLLAAGAPVHGWVWDGYWEDVGSLTAYAAVQADVLERRVGIDPAGFEISPGVWLGDGADVNPDAEVSGPAYIGSGTTIEAGARLLGGTVVGANVVVREQATLDRAIVHDNVLVGPGSELRGCIVGWRTDVRAGCRVEEGAVVADSCTLEDESIVGAGALVYPGKTVEAGALVRDHVIWETRASRHPVGIRGISGAVSVEISAQAAVGLASAFGTVLPPGSVVTVGRDHSRVGSAFAQATIAGLAAVGVDVRDLRVMPAPVIRSDTAGNSHGGAIIRATPGAPDNVDITLLDASGANPGADLIRRVERGGAGGEFRRPRASEFGVVLPASTAVEDYAARLRGAIDLTGVAGTGLRVVVDAGGGTAAIVLPTVLAGIGVDMLTVNSRLDEASADETAQDRSESLETLGRLVASSRADFGVRFDASAERMSLVDEVGRPLDAGRALLVVLDLVAAERRHGRVALPVSITRVAEQVAGFHGVDIAWTTHAGQELASLAGVDDLLFAGDGEGGFIVPSIGMHPDAIATFVAIIGLIARTQMRFSEIESRLPRTSMERAEVTTPWARKGAVMRAVLAAASGCTVDDTDGLRIIEGDGRWVLVLPHPTRAATRLWAEGPTPADSQDLLRRWSAIVVEAAA